MSDDVKLRFSERELLRKANEANERGEHLTVPPGDVAALVNRIGRLRAVARPDDAVLKAVKGAVDSIVTYDDPMQAHDLGALLAGQTWLEALAAVDTPEKGTTDGSD